MGLCHNRLFLSGEDNTGHTAAASADTRPVHAALRGTSRIGELLASTVATSPRVSKDSTDIREMLPKLHGPGRRGLGRIRSGQRPTEGILLWIEPIPVSPDQQ